MDNLTTCPSCDAEVRAGAKFCDNCGADLTTGAVAAPAEASTPVRGVNWMAIVILVLVIAGIWWLLAKDNNEPADPMLATGGTADNPHAGLDMGGMGGDTQNPHGGDTGDQMGDMMSQIEDAKALLSETPDDMEALSYLYQMYGVIGRGPQLREYVDGALAVMATKEAELGDELQTKCTRLAMSAFTGGDPESAEVVYDKVLELRPDFRLAHKLKADLKASMGLWDEALSGYENYLASANDLDDGQDYWSARVNKGMVYSELYAEVEGGGDPANLELALKEFTTLTEENPFYFEGWFGLGNVYETLGQMDDAIAAWESGTEVAMDDNRKWAAEVKIAEARGEEPPAAPNAGMGGMGGMGGGGAASPHGDMGGGADSANPHGGM